MVRTLDITPDNSKVVSGSEDTTVRVWDLKDGKELLVFTGHKETIRKVIISADGSKVISISSDNVVKAWDINTGQLLSPQESKTIVHPKRVCLKVGNVVRIFSADDAYETYQSYLLVDNNIACVQLTRDDKLFVGCEDGSCCFFKEE